MLPPQFCLPQLFLVDTGQERLQLHSQFRILSDCLSTPFADVNGETKVLRQVLQIPARGSFRAAQHAGMPSEAGTALHLGNELALSFWTKTLLL